MAMVKQAGTEFEKGMFVVEDNIAQSGSKKSSGRFVRLLLPAGFFSLYSASR